MTELLGTEILDNVRGQDGTGMPAATTFQRSTAAFAGAGGAFSTATTNALSSVALTNVGGLSQVLKSGTYRFYCNLPGTADATGGVKFAFSYTNLTLTSMDATGKAFTASGVAVQHTTTTASQTSLLSSTSAAIYSELVGVLTVSGTGLPATGATIQLQFAQSVSTAATSSVYANASMQFVKIGV